MKIRKAKKEDLNEISDIFKIESAKKPYFQSWNKKTVFESIIKSFKEQQIYLAELNNKPAGFIIFSKNETKKIWVDEFWINSKYQRKGIGKKLLSFIEEMSIKKGFTNIECFSHEKSNALKFYQKLNYKEKGKYFLMTKKLK